MKVVELRRLVQIQEDSNSNKYVTDNLATNTGKGLISERLPPCHRNLNHIEMVWSQVKGYMARHNKTFKLCEVHSAATGKRDWCYEA
jgi:hypothetical protein